jgi:hypothetical protein
MPARFAISNHLRRYAMIGSEVPGKLSVRARIECMVLFLVGSGVMGALVTGCAMAAPSDFGVTSGGQQDIAAARQVINGGEIPDPDWITVEGFLSEHSIPVAVPDNAGDLYVTAQTSWNADFDAFTSLVTVMVGFGTTIDRDSFQHDPLNLGIVIDRSGSMGDLINTRTGTSKLDAVKIAIDRLLSKLTADDRVTVVSFNNGSTLDEFLPYFDELAAGLIDRPSETSRSLSAERDLIVRLRANVAALR